VGISGTGNQKFQFEHGAFPNSPVFIPWRWVSVLFAVPCLIFDEKKTYMNLKMVLKLELKKMHRTA
jgi:hypothetical protein